MDYNERKQMYEGKSRYVARKYAENKEIGLENGLTEEQIEVLQELCTFRHELHCNLDVLYYSENGKHNYFESMLNNDIYEMLEKVNLPYQNMIFSTDDLCDDNVCLDLDYTDEEKENALQECLEFAGKVNNKIEDYLREIDKQYKTQFCPTGISRYDDLYERPKNYHR